MDFFTFLQTVSFGFSRSRRGCRNGAFRDASRLTELVPFAVVSIFLRGEEAVIVTESTGTWLANRRFIDSNEVQWRGRQFQSDVFRGTLLLVALLPAKQIYNSRL